MRYHKVPDETVRRLPIYLRGLLSRTYNLQENISSEQLGDILGIHSWQIRKDFSYFGDFGTPGIGYKVDTLIEQIRGILKLKGGQKAALVGAGKLGTAISLYNGFKTYGFEIAAIFDVDNDKIGTKIGDIVVEEELRCSEFTEAEIDDPCDFHFVQEHVGKPEVAMSDSVITQDRHLFPDLSEDFIGEFVGADRVDSALQFASRAGLQRCQDQQVYIRSETGRPVAPV